MSGKKSFSAVASRAFRSGMSSHSSESKKPDRSSNDNRRTNSSRPEGSRGTNNYEKAERTRPSAHIDRFFHVKPDKSFEPSRSHSAGPDRHIKFFAPGRSNNNDHDKPTKTLTPGKSSFNEHDRPARTLTPSRPHNDVPNRAVKTLTSRGSSIDKHEKQVRTLISRRMGTDVPDRQVRTLIPGRLHNNDRNKPTKTFIPGRSIFNDHDRQVRILTPDKSGARIHFKQIRSAFHSKSGIGTRQASTALRPGLKPAGRMAGQTQLVNKLAGSPKSHQTARMERIADQRHDRTLNPGNRPLQLKSGSRAKPDITTNPDRLTLFGNMKMRDKIAQPRTKQLSVAPKSGPKLANKAIRTTLPAKKHMIPGFGKPRCEVAFCPDGPENCCVMPEPQPPDNPCDDWMSILPCPYDDDDDWGPIMRTELKPERLDTAVFRKGQSEDYLKFAHPASHPAGHPSPRVLQNRPAGGTTRAMTPQRDQKASIATTRRDIIMNQRLASGNSPSQNLRSGFKASSAELGNTDAPSENNPDSGGSNGNNTAGNGSGNTNGSGNNIGSGNTITADKPTINIINIDAGGCSGPRGGGSGAPGGAGSIGGGSSNRDAK